MIEQRSTKGKEESVHNAGMEKKCLYIILGGVIKRGKTENTYRIEFINLVIVILTSKGFSMDDIADFKKTAKINSYDQGNRSK